MKKIYALSFLLLSAIGFAQISDAFLYSGSLSANGWSSHSGTAGQLTTQPGSLSYPGMTTSGNRAVLVAGNTEDVNLGSPTDLTGVAYYSALINVSNTTGLTPTGDYFLMFASTKGASATSFQGKLYIKTGSVANTFNLGIFNTSSTGTPSYLGTDFNIGISYLVVVKYEFASNTASLWVNPVIGGTETAPDITNNTGTTAAPAQIRSVAIREAGTAANGTGNIEVDEVKLGSTWAYVTSALLGVKENSISGLKLYPNPITDGRLYISSDLNSEKTVSIYDILGKQVLHSKIENETMNVSNLNPGVYIAKITEQGKTATRKLVIK